MRAHVEDAPPCEALLEGYRAVRRLTEALAAPRLVEDQQAQCMPDARTTRSSPWTLVR